MAEDNSKIGPGIIAAGFSVLVVFGLLVKSCIEGIVSWWHGLWADIFRMWDVAVALGKKGFTYLLIGLAIFAVGLLVYTFLSRVVPTLIRRAFYSIPLLQEKRRLKDQEGL